MKLTINNNKEKVVSAQSMNIGDIATIHNSEECREYRGTILLKTYDGLVSLNDPSVTWDADADFVVVIFKKGESVTLIQE